MLAKDLRFIGNILRQYREYLGRRTVLTARPSIFWIDTTSICNLKCPFCPTTYRGHEGRGHMDLALFKKIVDEISSYALECYLMQTGEPLLNKNIYAMVAYMTEKGIYSIMHTNATILTEDRARALLDAGLGYISFSFDGYDKETYERSRVNGKFEQTLANITGFLRVKQRLGKDKTYVRIQTLVNNFEDDRFSAEKRQAFMKHFDGLPVDEFDTEVISNLAREFPSNGVYEPGKPMTSDEHQRLGYRFKPCTRLWSSMTIQWDGKVVPCCVDFNGEMSVGDATATSLLEIWNGEPLRALRERHVRRDLEGLPLCSTCSFPYGKDALGIPVGMAGHHSILRKCLGPRLYRALFKGLRFQGLGPGRRDPSGEAAGAVREREAEKR
jgi:radical SAM protein with 4Fe4S-binding SPASM domain